MRLFLLVSALGAAHAKLMPYSAWPMRGRNALHAANGIEIALDNKVEVLKYNLTGMVRSSSAVGTDGTVYVGSDDGYLYALSADGSTKWKYKTGGPVTSSPALGFEGTVYVGSDDGHLYALSADGSTKWKYKTGGNVTSSPAVSAEDVEVVYFGSDDGYLYALNGDDGSLKWPGYKTGGAVSSSPAVAHGIVYVGSEDGNLYALHATNGSVKWKYRTEIKYYDDIKLVNQYSSSNARNGYYLELDAQKLSHTRNGFQVSTASPDKIDGSMATWHFAPETQPPGSHAVHYGDRVHLISKFKPDNYLNTWSAYKDTGYNVNTATDNELFERSATWKAQNAKTPSMVGPVKCGDNIKLVNQYTPSKTTTTLTSSADGSVVSTPSGVVEGGSATWQMYCPSIVSSPAIDANGTVYVGADDGYLYVIDAEGKLKWNYKTGGSINSSPAVGADSTVYVGSDDGYVYALHAASDNSPKVKGKYKTGAAVSSSPALSADGSTVYVGSQDGNLYALLANCSLKWKYPTGGAVLSSPALGADGAVYVGSNDAYLHVVGLSASHVTSSLHLAQSALARNESALPQLERLCNFNSLIQHLKVCHQLRQASNNDNGDDYSRRVCTGPHYIGTFPHETVELVDAACQLLNNTRNSPSYGRSWWSFVDPLSFIEYRQLISPSGTMMTILVGYENDLKNFEKAETTITDRIAIARDAIMGGDADAQNWQGVLKRDTSIMHAYGKEIVNLGQQMNSKFGAIHTDVMHLITNLTKKLKHLTKELQMAKNEAEKKKKWSFFSAIFKVVKAAVAVGSCFAESVETFGAALLVCAKESKDTIEDAVTSVKSCSKEFHSACEKCNNVRAEMQEAKDAEHEIEALAGMSKAAQALNAQLSTGKDLPEELPLLISDEVSMDKLRNSADALRQALVSETTGKEAEQFVNDIRDWTDMGVKRVSLFLSYYNIATHVQNDRGALTALNTRKQIVHDRLKDEQNKEAAAIAASLFMRERQQMQAMLVSKYIYKEFKQYHYLSLEPIEPIVLPNNTQSTDINKAQQKLDQHYVGYLKQMTTQSRTNSWIYVDVKDKAEPSTLKSMRETGSANFVLPIPLKSVTDPANNTAQVDMVANTSYHQMRLHNVGVYLLDKSGSPLGRDSNPVQLTLWQTGFSSFFDSNMALHEFSHDAVRHHSTYSPSIGCVISSGYCGGICADYIKYSPYGTWNVTISQAEEQRVDLSKLDSVRFMFEVENKQHDWFSPNYFGLDPSDYPQGKSATGTNCLPAKQAGTCAAAKHDEL